MKPITISIIPEDEPYAGAFVVEQDGKLHKALGWDEMLGQVVSLTFGQVQQRIARWGNNGLYPMKTPAEWQAERDRRELEAARRQHESEWDAA